MKKYFHKPVLFLFIICTINVVANAQTIYYVDSAKSDNYGNGSSWAAAKKNIQDAINVATSGAEIWVKAGTYYPDEGTGLTNNDRTSTFLLKNNIKIYGSFVGNETSITQRVIDVNNLTTILSGEIQQDSDTTNNTYHVVTAVDLSIATSLDGVKVKLGYANGGGLNQSNGGGMLIEIQSQTTNALRVTYSVFENNFAAHQGGAVYMAANIGKTIACHFGNSNFNKNKAGFDGGAIFAAALGGNNTSTLHSCGLQANTANSGGAMHIYADNNGDASLQLTFVYFVNNTANTDAGGLSNYVRKGVSNTALLFCGFINNYAGGNGGGIFSFVNEGTNNLKVEKSNFTSNKTAPTYSGGAVYVLTDNALSVNSTKVNKCKFTSNEAGFGGGVSYASLNGIITSYISQSLFTKNKADYGSAVDSYVNNGTTNEYIVNCTITENIADSTSAIETYKDGLGTSNLKAVNSIIWNNNNAATPNDVFTFESSDSLINCIIGNANCAATGSGNCSNTLYGINPSFVNPISGNYELQPYSAAINIGAVHPSTIQLDSTDILENPRYVGVIDLGAFENSCIANNSAVIFNTNGTIIQNVTGNTYLGNNCQSLLAFVQPNGGATAIAGSITGKVWIESAQPADFVKRHYEITPNNNANTATGKVTLYFTQAEFDAFNMVNNLDLPTSPTDAAGIANLLIEKRAGTSSNGSGLPNSYTGTIENINPNDADIIWNTTLSRWEVSFDVTGFSGFFVKTITDLLPVKWLNINGNINAQKQAVINWKVQENDVVKYEVEKTIHNSNWYKIGIVNGKGNGVNNYSFTELETLQNVAYYRIKQINNDGRFSYSSIIKLTNYPISKATIYPNPVKVQFTLHIPNNLLHTKAALFSTSGNKIKEILVNNQSAIIDMSELPSGTYILQLANSTVYKIFKE